MNISFKKWLTRIACVAMSLGIFVPLSTNGVIAEEASAAEKAPLTLELPETARGTGADYLDIDLGKIELTGTHIGIKVNPVTAIDQNGNKPQWSMFRIIFTDSNGKEWNTDNYGNVQTTIPGTNADGSATEITWMYKYLWPLQGFYGTMYLPWSLSTNGTAENPTAAPADIVKIRIQHNSNYSTARRYMLAHFFSLTDATIEEQAATDLMMGDVKVLEDFESDALSVTEKEIFNFGDVDLTKVTWSSNKVMEARFATEEEQAATKAIEEKLATEGFKNKYSTSGQPFDFSREKQQYGNALKWEYGSYYDEYVSTLNSYGSLTVPLKGTKRDWSGAKGLTVWVKNPQSYPISFNLEFSEAESSGSERWNLNGTDYRTLYFSNTVTGEEFSAPTLHVLFVPGNFEGWIRIPFSQYVCPSWSLAQGFDGVFDETKEHTNIYITSQFVLNDAVTMYFDRIGLYYNDFSCGQLFGTELPTIKECMEVTV